MNWLPLLDRILKKPSPQVVIPVIVFMVLLFAKWQLTFPFEALWFFLGSILGIYLLDIAEEVFKTKPSPFRNILFGLALLVLSFYVISSTTEYLAKGLVLSLFLNLCLLVATDIIQHRSVVSWYEMVSQSTNSQHTRLLLGGFISGVVLLTVVFIGS